MKKIHKLTPSLHANIWGGNKLRKYGKNSDADRIGESWELSFVPGAEALANGVPLSQMFPREYWGRRAEGFEFFPALTKFIDARERLSVQVHPSDDYAMKNEGGYGKSEMWYVVEADEGAGLYMGFESAVNKDELGAAIADGSIERLLSFKPVKAGDVFYIPAGTIHAIGAGTLIFEIQQNSTTTYRLYDYMRRDKDGNLRELHIDKALDVLIPDVYRKTEPTSDGKAGEIIGGCDYFKTRKYLLSDTPAKITVNGESFISLSVVKGEAILEAEDEREVLKIGESCFIPATNYEYTLTVSGDGILLSVEI